MTSKQYLKNSFYFNKRIGNNIMKMISCKMQSEKTTTAITGFPHNNNLSLSTMEMSVIERICLEANIRKEYSYYCTLRNELEAMISEISDEKYRLILRKRYMDALEWKEIAFFISYSIPQTFRLHTEALAAFDMIYTKRMRGSRMIVNDSC